MGHSGWGRQLECVSLREVGEIRWGVICACALAFQQLKAEGRLGVG